MPCAGFLRTVLALFALSTLIALPATAAELRVLVDLDNNVATGCNVATPAAFTGVEQVFITTVDTTASPPVVTQVARQDCVDASTGTFGAPVVVSAGGWNVGVGNGTAGTNVIESSLGLPPSAVQVRLGFVYFDSGIGSDVLFTGPGGAAIVVAKALAAARAVPTLSHGILALVAALVAGVGLLWARRHGVPLGPLAVLLFVLGTTLAWAAVVLDGFTTDWSGIAPVADAQGDAPSGTDIAAAFATIQGDTLFVRADVGTAMAPSAVTDSYSFTGTSLSTTAGSGLLANDSVGTPAGAITSFGAGALGGAVTDHPAGSTASFGTGGSFALNADGSFTFVAPSGSTSSFTFDYRLANAQGSSDATVTIAVEQAPAITSATAATFNVGAAGSFSFTATGIPAPAIAVSGALPGGVTYNATTHALSGTPANGSAGTYPLTITASNGVGSDASQSFTLTVNQATAITSAASTTFVSGTAGTFTIATSGVPAASTIGVSGTLPAGVTFTNNGDGTATLAGTANVTGNYPLTITATNGVGGTASQAFTLVVGQAPSITSASAATFAPGAAGSFGITTSGFPAGAAMTIGIAGTLPSGVTFTDNGNGTATLAGTPAAGTAGAYPVTITASNGVAPNASQSFTLNVTCPAIVVGGTTSFALTYNTAMSASTFTNTGGSGAITWSALGLPAGLSIDAGTGQLSGTPTATGSFAATVVATDASACAGALGVSIAVAPSLTGKSYATVGNTPLVAGATAPATPFVGATGLAVGDGSDTAITYSLALAPTQGSLVLNSDGTFVYTPLAGNTTSDSFTYAGTSNGVSATQTAAISFSGMVWYVDNSSTGAHDGRAATPFLGLGAGAGNLGSAATAAGDFIYVSRGSGATTGDYAMLANQRLVGAGATLAVPTVSPILTVPGNPANPPTLNSAITLASGASVSGIDMDGNGVRLAGSGVTGVSVDVGRFRRTLAGNAITISGGSSTGTLSFKSVSATGTVGGISGVSVSNFTGTFTVLGTDSTLTPNGGTISGFGANGMEFQNVSNGGSTSVSLAKMTLSGNGISQTVTGSACGNLASGNNLGCVANLYLGSVSGASLDTLTVTGSGQVGINGNSVTNLSIAGSTVTSNGNEAGESGILLQDAFGITTISNATVRDNAANQVYVENGSGTSTFSLTTGTLGFTSSAGANSQQGLLAAAHGTANLTVQVDGATVRNNKLDGVQVLADGNSTINGYVRNSTFDAGFRGVGAFASANGTLGSNIGSPFLIQFNSGFTNNTGPAGLMVQSLSGSTGQVNVKVDGNTVGSGTGVCNGTNFCDGIRVQRSGTGTLAATISNNTVQNFAAMGIDVLLDQSGSSAAKLSGNAIQNPSLTAGTYGSAVNLQVGDTAGGSACVDLRSQFIGAPTLTAWDPFGSLAAIYARASNSSVVSVAGYSGGNNDANLESYLAAVNAINAGTGSAVAALRQTSGSWANGPAFCSVP